MVLETLDLLQPVRITVEGEGREGEIRKSPCSIGSLGYLDAKSQGERRAQDRVKQHLFPTAAAAAVVGNR